MTDLLSHLRDATEDDVALALDRAMIELPLTTPAELLELFNRMLDVRTGEDDAAEFQDELNIKVRLPDLPPAISPHEGLSRSR